METKESLSIDLSDIQSEFIPGGSLLDFAPGGSYIPGKDIDGGKYIGLVRTWCGDRRVDRHVRIVDNELQEKNEYFYQGELFHAEEWGAGQGTWEDGNIKLSPFIHSIKSYIEILMTNWSEDDIDEFWKLAYEEHF